MGFIFSKIQNCYLYVVDIIGNYPAMSATRPIKSVFDRMY